MLVLVGVAGEGVELFAKFFIKKKSKKCKRILDGFELFFWIVVVAGLTLEISDEAKTDNEVIALNNRIAQTSTNVSNLDPLNRPIRMVSAHAEFVVRGAAPDQIWFPDQETNLWEAEYPSSLHLFKKDDNRSTIFSLDSQKRTRGSGKDETEYFIDFHMSSIFPLRWIESHPASIPIHVINKYENAEIDCDFLPERCEILGGTLTVTLNSGVLKMYDIPPQKSPGMGLLYGKAISDKTE
jgi:hypothetical protein